MSDKSLNERFMESKGEPVKVGGLTVYSQYKRPLSAGDRFHLTFADTNSDLVQGITLRAMSGTWPNPKRRRPYGGTLRVNDVESSAITLWMDTAPRRVTIDCVKASSDAFLAVSNRWRYADGFEDEYTNCAGIVIENSSHGVTLRCSNGFKEVDFANLVVELTLERAPNEAG
jgi:hypothetical protein